MSHAGKILLEVVARRFGAYCEAKGLLPEEQSRFRPDRSITYIMFVVRRLQEIRRKASVNWKESFDVEAGAIVVNPLHCHEDNNGM